MAILGSCFIENICIEEVLILILVPRMYFLIYFILFLPVYVEQGRSTTATTLTFTIATGGTWKVKVSQIECSKQVFF